MGEVVAKAVLFVVLFALLIVIGPFWFAWMWSLSVVPLFGMPELTWVQAFALVAVAHGLQRFPYKLFEGSK